jgi:hypothetical protein
MSLFFDADWFDAKLAERGLDRGTLAEAASIERADLHAIYVNERAANAAELDAFARALSVDIVEVTLRSGIATRDTEAHEDTSSRIESIEARLDAIDSWLEEFERSTKKSA